MSFVPGLQLSEAFYREAVRPILARAYPGLSHAAALIGPGSEVLGLDDATSTDHHWGPRVLLFLEEGDHARLADAMRAALAYELPTEFMGYSTHFSAPDPNDNGTQLLERIERGPVNHRVETHTLRGFVAEQLGFDLEEDLTAADWLTFPEQRLLHLTAGAVFHDGVGLEDVRARFADYPRDVWLYRMAAAWARVGQEEHLMGRTGDAGDEVGSALIGARLVRDCMRLGFLMERRYAPYAKWFGMAFRGLACAGELEPALQRALHARDWRKRERYLVAAYEALARRHNALGLTAPLPERAALFFGRPYRVIALRGFAEALLEQIEDPEVKRIASNAPIGGVDQFSDSTDLLEDPSWRPALKRLYH